MDDAWANGKGTLTVFVSKAKELPNLTKLDKQNVMLRLRVAHMTRESDVLLRAGQTPVFNYYEKFQMTPDVKPLMFVEVYCERKRKAPTVIGRCEVDLMNGIRADPKEGYCTWYDLKRDRGEFAGTIFIELTYKPALPSLIDRNSNSGMERSDRSIMARPIPSLPNNLSNSTGNMGTLPHHAETSSPYMHGSVVRQFTPQVGRDDDEMNNTYSSFHHSQGSSSSLGNGPPFNSSIGTALSTLSDATHNSVETTNSDTKFHFANLRKLKEKINVFKNPNSSFNTDKSESNNSVDIAALQKAIGVTSLDDDKNDDSSSDDEIYHREMLPPLPSGGTRHSTAFNSPQEDRRISMKPSRTPSPRRDHSRVPIYEHHSPTRGFPDSPKLPPLPSSVNSTSSRNSTTSVHSPRIPPLPNASLSSRNSSQSPTRRRPPPNF